MDSTHAYLSALVPFADIAREFVINPKRICAKARTFSAREGSWVGNPVFLRFEAEDLSGFHIMRSRQRLREEARGSAETYRPEELRTFGNLSYMLARIHGESFPTWIGDLHIEPHWFECGLTGIRSFTHYLVTEAPGLDCGLWEGDQLPVERQG